VSDADRLREAWALPSDSFLFLGANPAHVPEDERQRRESCVKCGGEVVASDGRPRARAGDADPIRLYETMVVACTCGRSTYEGRLRGRVAAPNLDALAVADHTTDRDDPTDRTGAAVKAANPSAVIVPGQPQKTLTRRERRARQFGKHPENLPGA
jgi:hypothetical protein